MTVQMRSTKSKGKNGKLNLSRQYMAPPATRKIDSEKIRPLLFQHTAPNSTTFKNFLFLKLHRYYFVETCGLYECKSILAQIYHLYQKLRGKQKKLT